MIKSISKAVILILIIIPTFLTIKIEAASDSNFFQTLSSGGDDYFFASAYFPKTGNLCRFSDGDNGYTRLEKLVIPKNLTLASYKKLKGTYFGRVLNRIKTSSYPNQIFRWKLAETNSYFNGNNITNTDIISALDKIRWNECNNNKMAVLLSRFNRENRK